MARPALLLVCLATGALLASGRDARADGGLFQLPEHLEALELSKAGTNGWRVVANVIQPAGGVAYPNEVVTLDLGLRNEGDAPLVAEPILEVVRIGTRFDRFDPALRSSTSDGEVVRLIPIGKPSRIELPKVQVARGKEAEIGWKAAKADEFQELGVYAVILDVPRRGRQAVATFARVRRPNRAGGDGKSSPLFCQLDPRIDRETQLDIVSRLGFTWVRDADMPGWASVSQGDVNAAFDWSKPDAWFKPLRKHGLFTLADLRGAPRRAVSDANWQAGNRVHDVLRDPRFGDFVQEFAARYCGPEGDGPLQLIDFWGGAWEGGMSAGWRCDAARYRALYKIVRERARQGSPRIQVGGPSSMANLFDVFLSQRDAESEWVRRFDFLTEHGVPPQACFGPRVARKLILLSLATGAWPCGSPDTLVATATHVLAAGQRKAGSCPVGELLWQNGLAGPMCTPTAAAASFFLHFTAGIEFERVVAHDRLPWVYQFGGRDRVAFVLAGDRSCVSPGSVILHRQIRADGTIAVDPMDGRLKAFDLYGHAPAVEEGTFRLPCSAASAYFEAPGLPADMVAANLLAGRIEGVTPVEFFADDFVQPIQRIKSFDFEIHNVLNRQIPGTVTVIPPSSVSLQETVTAVNIAAGASQVISLPVNWAKPHPANAYPFTFRFESAAGKAEWTEELHVNTIGYGTPVIDGSLTDWPHAIPVLMRSSDVEFNLAEAAWRPWEARRDVAKGLTEVRLAWDEKFLYLAVRDKAKDWLPKPRLSTRRDDDYFGTGDLAHTYVKDPLDALPFTGPCFQLALRFRMARTRLPASGLVPERMVAEDDSDVEYALWGAPDGGAEIWRSGAPDLGFFNFLPRCMPEGYDGVPKGAKAVVRRSGDDVIYEAAIPLADLSGLRPAPGKIIQIACAVPGSGTELGAGRSRPRANSLTLRPTWASRVSNDIRWGFIKE